MRELLLLLRRRRSLFSLRRPVCLHPLRLRLSCCIGHNLARVRHPCWRSPSLLPLPRYEAFKHENRFVNVLAFRAEFVDHLCQVHLGKCTAPAPGVSEEDQLLAVERGWLPDGYLLLLWLSRVTGASASGPRSKATRVRPRHPAREDRRA